MPTNTPHLKSITEILLMLSDSSRDSYFEYAAGTPGTILTNRAGRVLAVVDSADDVEFLRLFGYLKAGAPFFTPVYGTRFERHIPLTLAPDRAYPSLADRVSKKIPQSWRSYLFKAYEIERQAPGIILYHSL